MKCRKLDRGKFRFKQKFKETSTVHEMCPLILTESILLSFVPKTLICLQRSMSKHRHIIYVYGQSKWNHAVLIYNNDSVGIASLLTDIYFFNHWVDTHLKPVNILCELGRTLNFDFNDQTHPFWESTYS